MPTEDKEYHCEDCQYFNEDEVPADCLKGKGKVAFRRPVCPEFKFRGTQGSVAEDASRT